MALADLGLFGVGTRLTSLVTVIMNSFQGALTPLIITSYKEPETPAQIEKLFRYFVFFSLSLYLLISVFSKRNTDYFYYTSLLQCIHTSPFSSIR